MIFSRLIGGCLRDRGGNIAMIGALALPVVIFTGGIALDAANMMLARNRLQNSADSGALAASSGLANKNMTVDQAKKAAEAYVSMAMQNFENNSMGDEDTKELKKQIDANTTVDIKEKAAISGSKAYDITVKTSLTIPLNPMTKLFAGSSPTLVAESKSEARTETRNALSMYLVLDRSGSMNSKTTSGETKITALKAAVANLLNKLKEADPESTYIRTAAVSYNNKQDAVSPLDWGTAFATSYVNLLKATGGTDSSTPFETAYAAISSADETAAHVDRTGITPMKFIVFMTDGDNLNFNGKSGTDPGAKSNAATKASCDKAKADGIKVYAVAFMAPAGGQALLESCATETTYAYKAENSAALISAFAEIGNNASQIGVRLTQ